MSRLYLSLLGGISISLDSAPVTHFRSEKSRALLLYLAVENDRAHRRETLSTLFWGDLPTAAASHNLSQALFYLQQSMGKSQVSEFLDITRTTIQLRRESDWWMDVHELQLLQRICAAHPHRNIETCLTCLARLRQAVQLYRGEFLADYVLDDAPEFYEWLLVKREYFLRQAMMPLEHLVAHYEQQGAAALRQVIQFARRQIELEPWREEPHRALMRALAARGETSAALAQYQHLSRVLTEELGIEPSAETNALFKHLKQLHSAGSLEPSAPTDSGATRVPSNLPLPTTPLVGRTTELGHLSAQLANPDCRLLTLLGQGGIGKTRLAIQLARTNQAHFPRGVFFIDLTNISSSDLIPGVIAAALQFALRGAQSPAAQLVSYLRDLSQDVLLVLDNFEQLLTGAPDHAVLPSTALLSALLEHAPHVTLLVTSREKLNLRGEWVFQVEGLPAPAVLPERVRDDWASSEAVQLFVQCAARAVSPAPDWDESDRRAVMRVTRLVEGMPLAIELAAAWVRALAPTEIAREIEKGLDILVTKDRNVPARHASIRAVFEYSWRLLGESEQQVLARFAVFRGGFTREAAREVAGASLAILSALVDKSLVKRTTAGRYRLHELVRQFAAEKISPTDDADLRAQHARYYFDLLTRLGAQLNGTEARVALDALRHELENMRAAWGAALEHNDTLALLRALPHLSNLFEVAGLGQEGELLFQQTLAALEGKNQVLAARLYASLALFQHQAGNYAHAIRSAQAAVALGQAANDLVSEATAQEQWGVTLYREFQFPSAREHLERALLLARTGGLDAIQASAQLWLANLYENDADYATAEQIELDALRIAENIGDQRLASRVLSELARVANRRLDYARAAEYLERALPLKRLVGDPYGEARVLINLGVCAWAANRPDAARRYQLQALNLVQEIGDRAGAGVTMVNLAEGSLWMGDYVQARSEYADAHALGLELEQRWVEYTALWGLGMAHHSLGENDAAASFARQYLERVRAAAMREEEGLGLVLSGHIAAGQEDWDRAAKFFQAAEFLFQELGQASSAAEAVAGLAGVALAQGNLRRARELAEALAEQFDTIAPVFDIEPFRIFWTCYQIFRACGDARADEFLDKVYPLLQTRAAAIEDVQVRRMYLENIPWHRALVREGEQRSCSPASSTGA